MPLVAGFIDHLRAALGKEVVDQAIRDGLRAGTFWARENGHEVGKQPPSDGDRAITLDRMCPWNDRRESHDLPA